MAKALIEAEVQEALRRAVDDNFGFGDRMNLDEQRVYAGLVLASLRAAGFSVYPLKGKDVLAAMIVKGLEGR
jgi:hypothetical protein